MNQQRRRHNVPGTTLPHVAAAPTKVVVPVIGRYPFPEYIVNQMNSSVVMMPNQVDCIQDYATCRAVLQDAATAATIKGQTRNDPKYLQYANWFYRFRDDDHAIIQHGKMGGQDIEYWGGCKLLLLNESKNRNHLWNLAKEKLQSQSLSYHTNQSPEQW